MRKYLFVLLATVAVCGGIVVSASQLPSLVYVKPLDEHSHLITINGEQFLAIDLAKVKEMKANEIKLKEAAVEIARLNDSLGRTEHDLNLCKENVQDERVRVAKAEQNRDEHIALEKQCFTLFKHGGGKVGRVLDNPLVGLAKDVGLTAAQIANCR